PWGISARNTSGADLQLLDTNRDGNITAADDPYSPYYPGDEWVDWVGLTLYHKPSNNSVAEPNLLLQVNGFYSRFAEEKKKPFMISESGAAFQLNNPKGFGPGELAIKQSWWNQLLTNATILNAYPRLKMVCQSELLKTEDGIQHDYRIATNPQILNAFKQDFAAVGKEREEYVESEF
ncbi:hypothetical protein HK102_011435, partial [Quaeritorhiza haematococci]